MKFAHTAFVVVLVPTYWRHYGAGNFLWFSDVALLTSVPALWLESSRLASSQAAGVLAFEAAWLADFTAGLIARPTPLGLASYMFDRRLPRFLRALSLFHVWLTPLLLAVVSRRGYDRRAWRDETVTTWALLLATWRLTRPEDNVNWVFSRRQQIRSPAARAGFVALLMAAIPLLVQLPTHLVLKRVFPPPAR